MEKVDEGKSSPCFIRIGVLVIILVAGEGLLGLVLRVVLGGVLLGRDSKYSDSGAVTWAASSKLGCCFVLRATFDVVCTVGCQRSPGW